LAAVEWLISLSALAAQNPHQHRPITAMAVAQSRRVDVEIQAVL